MATRTQTILAAARKKGQKTLSEYDSKRILASYGIPVSKEALVTSQSAARAAAKKIGYPVVLRPARRTRRTRPRRA